MATRPATILPVLLWIAAAPSALLLGACPSETQEPECSLDTDCPSGRYCLPVSQVCHYDCVFDSECPEGYECTGRGRCRPIECEPTNGGLEACDGVDNDCDQATDEELGTRDCSAENAFGVCAGTERCLAGGWVCDAPQAAPEGCNALDDDCDGETDEGFSLGEACDGVGECGPGVLECRSGDQTRCSSDADGSQSQAVAEVCNGLDDDCDGLTDDGAPALESCELLAEAQDGRDNNCDGLTDEPGGCQRPHTFWPLFVDTYEAGVFEHADCTGRQYGVWGDDYPPGWPDGDQVPMLLLYACSLPDIRPSRAVTWHQAQRACQAQGKRLCTKQEWAQACGGALVLNYPYGQAYSPLICNTFSAGNGDTVATGSMTGCRTQDGLMDMSGNLWEWALDECEDGSDRMYIQGGSYYCASWVSGVGWEPCVLGDPDHERSITWMHACGYPPHDPYYCAYPEMTDVAYGFRCCYDPP